MKKNSKSYSFFQKATSIFLMMTLLWLTISTPFVIAGQQELAKQQKVLTVDPPGSDSADDADEDGANNTVEEKVPSTTNLSEEFLHEHHTTHFFFSIMSLYHKLENSDHIPPSTANSLFLRPMRPDLFSLFRVYNGRVKHITANECRPFQKKIHAYKRAVKKAINIHNNY